VSLGAALPLVLGVRGVRGLGAIVARDWPTAVADVSGALWMQISHLLMPTELFAGYYRSPGDPPPWAMFAAVAIAGATAFLAVTRLPRGSLERFGLAFAAIAYVPASNVFANWRWVADSYLYLPLVGVAIALSSFAGRVWPSKLGKLGWGVAVFAFADLAVLAHVQARTWSSSVALWQPVAERYPNDVRPVASLAGAYRWQRRDDEAVRALVDLEKRFPDYSDVRDDEAWAHMRLGQIEHATALIVRGIGEKNPGCIKQFWLALLASSSPPPIDQRDVVAKAFDVGFDAMKTGLHRPDDFLRIAAILESLGLHDRAQSARAHARALETR
jgi:hypothetical protein